MFHFDVQQFGVQRSAFGVRRDCDRDRDTKQSDPNRC